MDGPPVDFFAPAGRGLRHESLSSANRRAVLTSIATNLGSSIADLARLTGLAPQTASAIVSRLEVEGLVERGEVLRGRRGQPATPLFLRQNGAFSIGIEVGWQHADVLLSNLRLEVIGKRRKDFAFPDATSIVADIAGLVRELIDELPDDLHDRIVGIGLATPSNIHRGVGELGASGEQSTLWRALDLPAALGQATGLPVTWFNDGNAGCWAELISLPRPRPADMTYLHVGTFIGAGIVAEHMLWEGRRGNSANLGAMLVSTPDGYTPAHFIGSLFGLQKRLRAAGMAIPPGNPRDWPWATLEPVLSDWLETTAATLAYVIANTAAVYELDCAVIDGNMPRDLLARLVAGARREYQRLPLRTFVVPTFVEGRFGGDASSRGAAALVIYRRFFSRQPERMPG